ncbi:MAG TPA: multicopper oxidase domain-containing protein [Bryobacteraceae bacterium]|nr:multicopper oxidase domain-containing protein [Bryobacteraceae bacterium]
MKRRDFIRLGAAVLGAWSTDYSSAQTPGMIPSGGAQEPSKADITLRIAPVTVELAPNRIISTIGYNGCSPGPLLRMREGVPVMVDVVNDTDTPEYVHWHGLHIPCDVDGAEEVETPAVPPRGRRRYQITPRPAGTRWYHSHAMAMDDLHKGSYTGQFGFLLIEAGRDPGRYEQEVFLAVRDWEPFFTSDQMEDEDEDQSGPQPERPAVLDTRPNGLEVGSQMYSINDKALGFGEPIRVKQGDRVLFHLLNASAIEDRSLALPEHTFHVIALDGNAVPSPQSVQVLLLGPGERADAYVEMNQPGVWILGAPEDDIRNGGLGVVVEYENQHRQPQWIPPRKTSWDYTIFGTSAAPTAVIPDPDHTIDMIFTKIPGGAGKFNAWQVNGKQYPHEREFILKQGARYRLNFRNRTDDAHPLHLHRHSFELVDYNGKKTSGIVKDTVIVPFYGRTTVDLTADQPGLSLFHCHIQQHMDYGFKALFRCS